MNKYRVWHWGTQNKYKKELSTHIKNQLSDFIPIKGQYSVTYRYFYKDKRSDLSNVCSLASKVLNDALQEMGLIEQDSVKFLVQETFTVADHSPNDPRIEAIVTPEIF